MRMTASAKIAALAFGLSLASVPALAADDNQGRDRNDRDPAVNQQQDHHDQNSGDQNKGRKDRSDQNRNNGPKSDMRPSGYQNNANDNNGGGGNDRNRNRWRNDNRTGNSNTNTINNNTGNDNDRNRNRWRNNRNDNTNSNTRTIDNNSNDSRNWGNDNRRDRSHFDVSRYRRNYESPRRFRIGIYHAPRGYYYRRYSYGERLPIQFYVRNFWLTDFLSYGLDEPPPGFVWVRFGPDALLIDEETGEILQVRYDVFYS